MARNTRPQTKQYDYKVVMEPLALQDGSPSGWMGTKRTDTGQVLGVCTEQYGIMDNATLFDGVEQTFEDLGMTDYEKSVTVVRDGARVYGRYDFKNRTTTVRTGGDELGLRLTVNNSFDRSCRASFSLGMLRLVCLNGMVTVDDEFSMSKKHTKKITSDFIEDALQSALKSFQDGSATAVYELLAKKTVSQEQGLNVLLNLEKKNILSGRVREAIQLNWQNPSYTEDEGRNLYSLLNSVTQHLTRDIEAERFEYAEGINRRVLSTFNRAARLEGTFDKLVAPSKKVSLTDI
jgi:hypothetical protein